MAYNMSKSKGSRVEYEIRDLFRSLGYECHRVPASGAAQGFPGDLEVTRGSEKFLVEVKARATEFNKIYEGLGKRPFPNFPWKVIVSPPEGTMASEAFIISPTFQDLLGSNHQLEWDNNTKDAKRILKLKKYLGKCNFLVIRGNRKKPLFIRFF